MEGTFGRAWGYVEQAWGVLGRPWSLEIASWMHPGGILKNFRGVLSPESFYMRPGGFGGHLGGAKAGPRLV